jgi:hypothetical protein
MEEDQPKKTKTFRPADLHDYQNGDDKPFTMAWNQRSRWPE